MSFFKPFDRINTEVKSDFDLEHIGTVVDNNDPLKLYRLKIMIPIWEEIPIEYLPWVHPQLFHFLGLTTKSVFASIPNIGSECIVIFPTKDKYNPEYRMASPTNRNKCTFLDAEYPHAYGYIDDSGNFFKTNKLTNTTTTNCVGSVINNSNATTNNVTTTLTDNCNDREINITGEMNINHSSGTFVQIDSIGGVKVNGVSLVEIISAISIDLVAPNVNVIGNLKASTGISTTIPVGLNVLTFNGGILVNNVTL